MALWVADGLREFSVSYGSKGEVVTRKAFPMERYVLDKEPKRNLHRNKGQNIFKYSWCIVFSYIILTYAEN